MRLSSTYPARVLRTSHSQPRLQNLPLAAARRHVHDAAGFSGVNQEHKSENCDVLIVGGGPAGLALASALGSLCAPMNFWS
jgi:NADPH-dependent 2,4-dienoyl-CoA reductase/sulfur reductase-like enzyme